MSAVSDIDLSDQFVSENLGLVHSCCHRLANRGIEYEELFSAGCLGLVKAVKGFDKSRGLCFSTYAVPVILGEIRRLFRDGGSVKISRSLKELSLKVTREKQKMEVELGREPTIHELSARMSVSPEQVAEAICAASPVVSLTVGEDEEQNKELQLPVSGGEEDFCNKTALHEALLKLSEQDRKLIILRYYQHNTQSKTAEKLNMTQVQVSRREKVILSVMREELV